MTDTGERLQRFLARAGIASRRGAEELIQAGRVRVNGRPAELGMRVVAGDRVEVDGREVTAVQQTVTLALNKPPGYLSAVSDDRGRKTVMELLPPYAGLHPIGRLDLESEGLLLLTNDGNLTLELTHPRHQHPKRYRVWCREGRVADQALSRLRRGVELEDGPARASWAGPTPEGCELVITEGRKRQVRRMLAAVGYRVERLQRTAIGRLGLAGLKPGEWKELGPDEVRLALAVEARRGGDPERPKRR